MVRRHQSLIPLAQDHYHGLLLVQQIREHKRIIMTGWPPDPAGQARRVAEFYEEHLKNHFDAEEQALFPLASKHVESARAVVQELLNEHRALETFVAQFREAAEGITEQRIEEFASLLEQHIRKEDRVLFPLLEEHAPAEVLSQVESLMHPFYDDKTKEQ